MKQPKYQSLAALLMCFVTPTIFIIRKFIRATLESPLAEALMVVYAA
ncbi:hypothetical protein [Paenibacillus sp. FSL H7-0331]|nr:hypothetical protein [Paenibacillus sp. FSL H7-0331]